MIYTIKSVTASDIGLFHQLLDCFGSAFNEVDVYDAQRPVTNHIEHLLTETHRQFFKNHRKTVCKFAAKPLFF